MLKIRTSAAINVVQIPLTKGRYDSTTINCTFLGFILAISTSFADEIAISEPLLELCRQGDVVFNTVKEGFLTASDWLFC